MLLPSVPQPFSDGVLEYRRQGVLLYLDSENEVQYIETSPAFSMEALIQSYAWATEMGYEAMSDAELGVDELPEGRVRHWLAIKSTSWVDMGIMSERREIDRTTTE